MARDRRQQIMDAVEALFASRRFHEITIEEVARKAGVGKGTVYRYFACKDELFFQVAMAGYGELCELVSAGTADTGPYWEVFGRVCDAVGEFYARRPRVHHLMQAEDRCASRRRGRRRQAWRERKGELLGAFGRLVARGQSEGLLRGDLCADGLASCLLALLRSTGYRNRDQSGGTPAEVAVDLFVHGAGRCAGEVLGR